MCKALIIKEITIKTTLHLLYTTLHYFTLYEITIITLQ
jgi:hypothetical protein